LKSDDRGKYRIRDGYRKKGLALVFALIENLSRTDDGKFPLELQTELACTAWEK
jgi:hypothetical protein